MAVTIADVAKRAGVSRSTVSYVLSGVRSISPETTRRVEQAIEDLQFRPHAGARSIRTGRNGVIAMALPMVYGPHNQVQMPYVWAALTAAQDVGLKLLMLTDDDGEAAIRDTVVGSQVDGVMLMEVQRHDPRVALLSSLKCPAVLVGTPRRPRACRTWTSTPRWPAGCAPSCCWISGIPASAISGSRRRRSAATSRTRSTRATAHWPRCAPAGPALPGRPATASRPEVARAVDTLLTKTPDLSGLIVYNERALPLVVDRLSGLGLRVPQDVSVVAVCPDDEAERSPKHFTAVSLPVEDLARTAVRLLAGLVNGERVPSATILAPVLKVRDTTAPKS